MTFTTVHIYPEAPPKPVVGAACNGCGVCCLMEPCPLGVLLSGRRHGACTALRWQAAGAQYRCGAIMDAHAVSERVLPRYLHVLTPCLVRLLGYVAGRWIALGVGCDCESQVLPLASLSEDRLPVD